MSRNTAGSSRLLARYPLWRYAGSANFGKAKADYTHMSVTGGRRFAAIKTAPLDLRGAFLCIEATKKIFFGGCNKDLNSNGGVL